MPSWTGWNEREVRQGPVTAGFTAINTAPPPTPGAAQTTDTQAVDAHPTKSVVSGYLGRGEVAAQYAAVSQLLQAPGAKRVGGKGKKRASTANAAPKAKRRKASNVSEVMGVTKFNVSSTNAQSQSTTKEREKGSASLPAQNGSLQHASPETSAPDAINSVEARAVHVYAQSTSMDSIQPCTHTTSLDALKSSTGHGYTAYSSSPLKDPGQSGVEFAQPWLNTATASVDNAPQCTAKVSSFRKSNETPATPALPDKQALNTTAEAPAEKMLKRTRARTALKPNSESRPAGPTSKTHDSWEPTASRKQPSRKAKTMPATDDLATLADSSSTLADSDDDAMVDAVKAVEAAAMPRQQSESSRGPKQHKRKEAKTRTAVDELINLSDADDDAMVDAAESVEATIVQRQQTPPSRSLKQNMREVDHNEDYGGALFSEPERQLLDELRLSSQEKAIKPIVRNAFPPPVLDRSPVFGASNNTVLRVCFRIGEALNVGCQAVREGKDVLLELYARVTSSVREEKPSRKQIFTFKDLYHDNPPHLHGSYALWSQSQLWDLDSKAFLVPRNGGKMCRAIARMQRDGTKWRLEVLSIWEASWDDVEHVAGIYAKRTETEGHTEEDL